MEWVSCWASCDLSKQCHLATWSFGHSPTRGQFKSAGGSGGEGVVSSAGGIIITKSPREGGSDSTATEAGSGLHTHHWDTGIEGSRLSGQDMQDFTWVGYRHRPCRTHGDMDVTWRTFSWIRQHMQDNIVIGTRQDPSLIGTVNTGSLLIGSGHAWRAPVWKEGGHAWRAPFWKEGGNAWRFPFWKEGGPAYLPHDWHTGLCKHVSFVIIQSYYFFTYF